MTRITLIVNPTAGRGRAGRQAEKVRKAIEAQGANTELVFTQCRGQAQDLAADAIERGAAIVVAVGGDGTLHEVANAVLAADTGKVTLGLIPLGTGNDFARGVRIYGDLPLACNALTGGVRTYVDIGRIEADGLPGGRWFLVAAGLGYVADAAATVNNGIRFLSGAPAYLWGAAITLTRARPFEIGIRIDGRDLNMSEAMLVSISNVETTGGGIKIAPGADACDGVFDVCVVGPMTRMELLGQLPHVLDGTHIRHPAVDLVRGQLIEIETATPKPLWIDGEVIGNTPATFRMSHGQLPIMLPNPDNR